MLGNIFERKDNLQLQITLISHTKRDSPEAGLFSALIFCSYFY